MLYSAAITCFMSVAAEQSISRSAKKMYISPQAVSKQIQRLEQEVGTPLFYRNSNEMTLTPAGKIYHAHFTEVIKSLEKAQSAVAALSENAEFIHSGCVKGLNIDAEMSDLLSPKTLLEADIHLIWERDESYRLVNRLLGNDLDIIITYENDLDSSELDSIPFLENEHCAVVSHNLPGADEITDVHELSRYRILSWVLDGLPEINTRKGYQRICEKCGFSPDDIILLPNVESLETAINMGSGFTIVSRLDRLCSSELVKVFPLGVSCDISVAWRKNEVKPEVLALINNIKQVLGKKE